MNHKIALLALLFISTFGVAQTSITKNVVTLISFEPDTGLVPTNTDDVIIQAGKAVNFDTSGTVTQALTIDPSASLNIAASMAIPTIILTADNNAGTVKSTEIKYMSVATLGLDPGYDAGQFGGSGADAFNLYTHLVQDNNGVKFALQVVPDTNYETTVIPIGIDANAGTQITFKATATDLPTGKKVFLEDILLNTVTEINNTDKSYTVTLPSTLSGSGRFFLHTLNVAATLTFQPTSGSWFLASSWSPAQLPTSIDDVIIPTGKTITIGSSGAVAKNIAINAGTLNIVATGSLTVSNAITNNGTLTIASDASNSGSVIVGSYSGNTATYQRYLTGSEWHLFSTPLSAGAQTIANFVSNYSGAMTQSGVQYSLGTYDNNFVADGTSTWQNYTSDGSNPAPASSFPAGVGYEILMNSSGTVDLTGSINTAEPTFTLTENVTGWNLIGNPFPSSIFGNTSANPTHNFLTNNSAELDPSFVSMYLWNPTNGSYDIVNQASAARSLAPGQAFFVKSKTGGGTATFAANMRTHQSANNFLRSTTTLIPTINLTIDDNAGTVRDTEIKYMSGTTLGLDPGYDGGQLGAVGTSNFNLYTHLVEDNGVKFALQVVPDTGYDTTVIPVGIDANAGTQVTFKATATDLPDGIKVFIEDKVLNTVTEINNTDKSYTVNLSTALSGTGRFYLHTQENTLAIDDFSALQYTLVTSPEQNNIRLYGVVAEKGSVDIFDIFGRKIHATKLQTGSEQNINMPVMSTGVYIVKFNIDNKPFSKKILWY